MGSESTEQVVEVPTAVEEKTLFPEVTQLRFCTANVCVNGHEFVPKMALAKCGYGTPQGWNGCGSPVLAVKMENCPACNQPVEKIRFRMDYTAPTQFPIPMCIPGSQTQAEVQEIILHRKQYLKTQEVWDQKIKEEQEKENE